MAVEPLHLLTDEPIRHYRDDGLGLRQYADVIAGAALGTPGPFTIGVFGDWGQGKTSLLRSAMSLVDDAGRDDVVTVWFNAWRHERDEEPIVPLIGTIVAALGEGEGKPGFRGRLANALKALAYGLSFRLNLGAIRVDVSGKDMVDREEDLEARAAGTFAEQSMYLDAYEALAKLTQQDDDEPPLKIVVFIDDLDRCLPDKGLRLLEGLKLVLAQPGFVFVLAADREVVQSYLAKRYRDEFGVENAEDRSARYLYKIVQLPLGLPSHEGRFDDFIEHLRGHEALRGDDNPVAAAFEELRDVLGAGTQYNPRSLVRLVNNLIVDQSTWVANQEDPTGLLGVAAVARILRDHLGGLYRQLVADDELCAVIAHPDTELVPEHLGTEEVSGRRARQRRQIAARLDGAGLGPLLSTAAARAWLSNHDARRRFDQFLFAPEQVVDQGSIVVDAIRAALGIPNGAPILMDVTPGVLHLDLSNSGATDAAIPHVTQLVNLNTLQLDGTAISDAAIPPLAQLTNLTTLSLARTGITDEGSPHLADLVNLTTLSLNNTEVTDAAIPHLVRLAGLKNLYLNGTRISDSGVGGLTQLAELVGLGLRGTAVTDAAVEGIATLPHLRHLGLSDTAVTDAAVGALTQTKLTQLYLGSTAVSDAAMDDLARLSDLRTLYLKGTQLTDDAVKYLARLPRLSTVDLRDTRITEAGLGELGHRRPRLTIRG